MAWRAATKPRRPNPRLTVHSESFFFHIKPSYYHQSVTKISHTFRMGLLSTYFFILETITGIFLMIFYAPTPERAYGDMLKILSGVPFGQFMRDIHRLGAEGMVIVVTLHMVRTFLTGSYKKPSQFTWLTGVILLLATLLMSFSGYLLPWDQLAYWAVTIGTSMADKAPVVGASTKLLLLGAPSIGAGGLLRFYLLHVLFVPLAIIFVFFIHYYKVVRVGISLPSSEEEVGQDTAKRVPADKRRYYLPDVFTDEMVFLGLITFILLALILFGIYPGAPLEHHANANQDPAAHRSAVVLPLDPRPVEAGRSDADGRRRCRPSSSAYWPSSRTSTSTPAVAPRIGAWRSRSGCSAAPPSSS